MVCSSALAMVTVAGEARKWSTTAGRVDCFNARKDVDERLETLEAFCFQRAHCPFRAMSPCLDSLSMRRNFHQLRLGYEEQRSDSTQLQCGSHHALFCSCFFSCRPRDNPALLADCQHSQPKASGRDNQTNGFFGRAAPVHRYP